MVNTKLALITCHEPHVQLQCLPQRVQCSSIASPQDLADLLNMVLRYTSCKANTSMLGTYNGRWARAHLTPSGGSQWRAAHERHRTRLPTTTCLLHGYKDLNDKGPAILWMCQAGKCGNLQDKGMITTSNLASLHWLTMWVKFSCGQATASKA